MSTRGSRLHAGAARKDRSRRGADTMERRACLYTIRMSEPERAELERVTKYWGFISTSACVRWLVRAQLDKIARFEEGRRRESTTTPNGRTTA